MKKGLVYSVALLAVIGIFGCNEQKSTTVSQSNNSTIATKSVPSSELDALATKAKQAGLLPIPADEKELLKLIDNPKNPITPEKVELGKKLFFDPRLSKSSLISCNT